MFGRVRPSSCPVDCLERPSSKIIKHDSLSIYDYRGISNKQKRRVRCHSSSNTLPAGCYSTKATLVKLKVGAQRDLSLHSEEAMEIPIECTDGSVPECSQHTVSSSQESMTIDADSPLASESSNSSYSQSTGSLKQHISRNVSIFHLFSKYGKSRDILSSACDEAIALENVCSASSSTESSTCSTDSNWNMSVSVLN